MKELGFVVISHCFDIYFKTFAFHLFRHSPVRFAWALVCADAPGVHRFALNIASKMRTITLALIDPLERTHFGQLKSQFSTIFWHIWSKLSSVCSAFLLNFDLSLDSAVRWRDETHFTRLGPNVALVQGDSFLSPEASCSLLSCSDQNEANPYSWRANIDFASFPSEIRMLALH